MRLRLSLTLVAALVASATGAGTLELTPDQDNTLYQDDGGALSNGAGMHFFVGTNNMNLVRRAVLRFDLSTIPSGATIDSARLTLNMSRTIAGGTVVTLHRASADWGEGDSDAEGEEGGGAPSQNGDATWIHRFFSGQGWSSDGGDFSASSSDAVTVSGEGSYVWESADMRDDVQGWVNQPSQNFGWLMRGDEGSAGSAKRFDSRENPSGGDRPLLEIEFTPPVPVLLQSFEIEP